MFEINDLSYTRERLLSDMKQGLAPIEGAYRKWTAIMNGGEDFGTYSCACCETYYDPNNPKACYSVCPLGNTDGCCRGEYSRWVKHQNAEHMHEYVFYAIRCPECKEIASNIMSVIDEKHKLYLKQTG